MSDSEAWDFSSNFAFSLLDLSSSFDFCAVAPDCNCSKMLVQMLKQSSQRLKPYFSRYSFFVSLQSWHLPVSVPMMKMFLGHAADLLFFAASINSHLYESIGSVLAGRYIYRNSVVLSDGCIILVVLCSLLFSQFCASTFS